MQQTSVRLHIDRLGTEFVLKQFKIPNNSKDQIFDNQLIKKVESNRRISGAVTKY